jgi:hypothetical protein
MERKKLLFLCECFSLSMNYVALHVKSFLPILPTNSVYVYAEVDMYMPMDMWIIPQVSSKSERTSFLCNLFYSFLYFLLSLKLLYLIVRGLRLLSSWFVHMQAEMHHSKMIVFGKYSTNYFTIINPWENCVTRIEDSNWIPYLCPHNHSSYMRMIIEIHVMFNVEL